MMDGPTNKEGTWPTIITSSISARVPGEEDQKSPPKWSLDVPVPAQVESMLVAGKVLVFAGTTSFVDHKGAFLWTVSAETGKKLNEIKLDSPPTWEGMAAAGGRLYVSCIDGKLRCFGK